MPKIDLQEGIDFYLENGYLVFTSNYLARRGFCCKSGCRHCPYGYKKGHPEKEARQENSANTDSPLSKIQTPEPD